MLLSNAELLVYKSVMALRIAESIEACDTSDPAPMILDWMQGAIWYLCPVMALRIMESIVEWLPAVEIVQEHYITKKEQLFA